MTPQDSQPEKQRSGVKLIRNTKGWSFEVHVYAGDTDLDEVLVSIGRYVGELNEGYPRE